MKQNQILQLKRNECLNLVRPSNRKVNEFRFSVSESTEHINLKEKVCTRIHKLEMDYVCEPMFINGGRGDVLCLQNFTVYEVMISEKDESIKNKKCYYPEGLKIIQIREESDVEKITY